MLDRSFSAEIQQRIDQKTKPLGALGQLERVAHHLALIQSQNQDQAVTQLAIHQPTVWFLPPITASLRKVSVLRQAQ